MTRTATASVANNILHSSDRHHLMLLYADELARNAAEIECIEQSLKARHYCVYASVDLHDKEYLSRTASKIADYQRHVKEGNLSIVDFAPFYNSASRGDVTPFDQLKERIEKAVECRIASGKNGKALVVADAACNLTKDARFNECIHLEKWWQNTYTEWMQKNLDITIICAHPSMVLKEASAEQSRISHAHSLTLDLQELIKPPQIRILVAESDPDMGMIYKRYLDLLNVSVTVVQDAKECLEKVLLPNGDIQETFDLIIIDSHIKDASGLHVARKILEEKSDQPIVFTTTWNRDSISSEIELHSLDSMRYPILEKPFSFTQLLAMVKPLKSKANN